MTGVREGNDPMSSPSSGSLSMDVAVEVLASMIDNKVTREEIMTLPFGVAVPLLEIVRACRTNPPEGLPASGYALLSRDDLVAQSVGSWDARVTTRSHRGEAAGRIGGNRAGEEALVISGDDGTTVNSDVTALRFGKDLRVKEVQRLLCSSKPVLVRVHQVRSRPFAQLGFRDQPY